MEQNSIQTDKVNTYEEDNKEKNCFNCEFLRADLNSDLVCIRRIDKGVVLNLDKDKAHLPCPARDAEVWDEEIDENGDFKVDNELGYGYQRWIKKMEENRYDDEA